MAGHITTKRCQLAKKYGVPNQQTFVPGHHSLRTYFSHHTVNVGPGPGWDTRFRLTSLTPELMMERYGHEFTDDEISNPMGKKDWTTGEVTGGMPNDIPYYELVSDEAHDFEAERAALLARMVR